MFLKKKKWRLNNYEKDEISRFSIMRPSYSCFLFVGDKNVKTLRSLLCAAINAVDELYPKADIRFTAINPASYGLAQGIFGDEIKPLPLICARWNGLSADVLNGIDGLEELDEEEEA